MTCVHVVCAFRLLPFEWFSKALYKRGEGWPAALSASLHGHLEALVFQATTAAI